MQKIFLNKQVRQLMVSCLIALTSVKTSGQITYPDESVPLKTKEFFIKGISDERTDKNTAAELIIKDKTTTPTVY